MSKTLWHMTFDAALLAGSLAFAQEAEAPATTDAATGGEATAETQATTELPLGEEVGPKAGDRYIKEVIQDWELRCVVTGTEDPDPCQMYQLLKDENGNPTAEISLFKLPEGGKAVAGATVITPLETLLTSQVTTQVDQGAAKRYPFSFCSNIGCVARMGLTDEDVLSYKRGAVARVAIAHVAAPDKTIVLEMSLSGFTAAFDATDVFEN